MHWDSTKPLKLTHKQHWKNLLNWEGNQEEATIIQYSSYRRWKQRITLTLSFNRWSLDAAVFLCCGIIDEDEMEYLLPTGGLGFRSSCSDGTEVDGDDDFHGSKPVTSQLQRFRCSAIFLRFRFSNVQISKHERKRNGMNERNIYIYV